MPSKFASKPGLVVEAHVVSEAEKILEAKLENGNDTLRTGDALLTHRGKQYIVRAGLWDALFGEAADEEPAAKGKTGKGGQHESPPPK